MGFGLGGIVQEKAWIVQVGKEVCGSTPLALKEKHRCVTKGF